MRRNDLGSVLNSGYLKPIDNCMAGSLDCPTPDKCHVSIYSIVGRSTVGIFQPKAYAREVRNHLGIISGMKIKIAVQMADSLRYESASRGMETCNRSRSIWLPNSIIGMTPASSFGPPPKSTPTSKSSSSSSWLRRANSFS